MLKNRNKKQSEEYAKRIERVLKEFKEIFKPQSIKERIGYNMMMNQFISKLCDEVKHGEPKKVKEAIETLIKRLMWIIE